MPNAFDEALAGSAATKPNPFDAAVASKGGNPFDSALHAAGALGGAASGAFNRIGGNKVIDLLDRPRQATQATITGGWDKLFPTLVHGQSPEGIAQTRAELRQKWGLPGDAERAQAGGLRGGVDDFALDTVSDPMSLAGGFLLRGLGTGIRYGAGAAAKVAPELAKDLSEGGNAIGDMFRFKGAERRALGEERFGQALAAESRQAAEAEEATRRLVAHRDAVMAGLSEPEEFNVYRILNGEAPKGPVTAATAAAAKGMGDLFNHLAYLQGDDAARRLLSYGKNRFVSNADVRANAELAANQWRRPGAGVIDPTRGFRNAGRGRGSPDSAGLMYAMQHADDAIPKPSAFRVVARADRPYALPDDLREFAAPSDQGPMGIDLIRKDYLPTPRNPAEIAASATKRPRPVNLLRPVSGNLMQRGDIEKGAGLFSVREEDVPAIREAIDSALRSGANQATAGSLRARLGVPLSESAPHPPDFEALERVLTRTPRAQGDARTPLERLVDRWQQVVNIPKNTVTTIGLKHGLVNVPTLAAASAGPGAAAEALVKGAQVARMDPGARYEALRPAIEAGLAAPFADRANPIADALARIPGPIGKGLGAATEGANRLTWAIDDAAKAAVYKHKIASGMTPGKAYLETMRDMVDYRHRSPFVEKVLSNLAPFATFRAGIPAAIASNVAKAPKNVLALDRATAGLSSTGEVQIGTNPDGTPRRLNLTTPISDVLGGLSAPEKYARSTMADPLKAAFSPVALQQTRADGSTYFSPRYTTYGQPLLPYQTDDGQWKAGFLVSAAAGDIPFGLGDQLLSATKTSEFAPEDWLSILLGSALGAHVR